MILGSNHTKKILKSGGAAFGTMVTTFRSPAIVPMMASAGWDYIILDNEHNAFGPETIQALALAASYEEMDLLVRIPSIEYHHIAKTLDLGVGGLVIPHVESSEDAERIVKSSYYYPKGERGASMASKASRFPGLKIPDYLEWAAREILIAVQIETIRGVENADGILGVDGIDSVMIGPFDLSQSLGCPGEMDNPAVARACREVIRSCREHGVNSGIHIQSIEDAGLWKSLGMTFITCKTEAGMINRAAFETVAGLRKLG